MFLALWWAFWWAFWDVAGQAAVRDLCREVSQGRGCGWLRMAAA
jgi:hypothetical protein